MKGSPELFSPSVMRKKEELWGREWPPASGFSVFVIQACAEIKIFDFALSVSCSLLFVAVIDFLLGLLVVKKLLRKRHRDG